MEKGHENGNPPAGEDEAASPELIPNGANELYTVKSLLLGSPSSKCQLCLAGPPTPLGLISRQGNDGSEG